MSNPLRSLGLGPLALKLWYRPMRALRNLIAEGGPFERHRTEFGRVEMESFARQLPLPSAADGRPVELYLLTGRKYWYQTAFCLWTFAKHANRPLAPVILDDGTLTAEYREPIERLFPQTRFLAESEIITRLDTHLPRGNYPVLRARRSVFPLLRKITDIHAGFVGWKLFLDSDLLFFRKPNFLIKWHDAPTMPLRGEDIQNAYGYPLALMTELVGKPMPERVNTGTIGLCSEEIDWERMEFWCRELQTRAGTSYYQEQALVAMHLAGRQCAVTPPADYVLLPRLPEAKDCHAVMHHYVSHSKRWYFQKNWQIAIKGASQGE